MGGDAPGPAHERRCPPAPREEPKRILHVVSSLKVGGMEQFALRLTAEQQRRGHQVTLLGLQGGPLLDQAREAGIDVHVLGGRHAAFRVLKAIRLLRWRRPEIAHAHNPSALQYALVARLLHGARVIMTRHGQEPKRVGSRWQWRQIDAVAAVSDAAAEALRRSNPGHDEKIVRIYNGVQVTPPVRARAAMRAELAVGNACVGVFVARLDPLKGLEDLVRALAQLRDESAPVMLLIAGDGPARGPVEQRARELKLGADRLRLLGFRNDVPDLLCAADFYVLPSLTEGLPLSLLEAMAHRLPVLATPVGGIPEVVRDGEDGLLVPANDPQALAQAMARLAGDAVLRAALGEAAFRRVTKQFSFEQMVREYEALYHACVARSRHPAPGKGK